MTEFYSEDGPVDDFALPGDNDLIAAMTGEQPEAEAAEERARDEQGRFVKAEAEPEEQPEQEPEAAAEPEPEAAPAEPELILGKFKSADELAAAYQELEQFRGRQANEIGELRQALEERFASLEQQAQRPATPSNWEELILDNPAAATKHAYQVGDQYALQRAAAAWEEVSPGAPELWAETVRMRAEMEQRFSTYEQQLQPVQQQTQQTTLRSHALELQAKYPDIGEFMASDDIGALADQVPLAREALSSGDPQKAALAIETLYLINRGRSGDNLKETAREAARTAAEEAQKVREEAYVASATATTTAVRPSRADEIAAGWDDDETRFQSGWNV